jgi:trimethylamine--corrinoid protein Co-methyltransferase
VLSGEDLDAVDRTARRLLAEVGILFRDTAFLDRVGRTGAEVDRATRTVRMPEAWLDDRLASAPERFTLHARDGQNDLALGEGRVHFGNGGRVFRVLDQQSGGYRLTGLDDVARTAALVQALDHIAFYIIACQAHDVAPERYHIHDFFQAFHHTSKHVMGGVTSLEGFRQMTSLAERIAGGAHRLRDRPFVSVITNPLSPLTFDRDTLNILAACAAHGIPATCAPAPISGATAPATLAGTLTQMHAEALAGVALAQSFAPGAKVLYGAVATAMDLRKMELTLGSVETAMMNAAAVQLAKRYRLPIYASAGVTESKTPDLQAGFEKTASLLLVGLSGADFVHLAAGMLDSGNSISFEQFVIDNEILSMVHRLLTGVNVNGETLGFDVIRKVGQGGNFVTETHTIDHMMEEFYYPGLCVRSNFDIWEREGRPSMLTRARDVVAHILDRGMEGILELHQVADLRSAFPELDNP